MRTAADMEIILTEKGAVVVVERPSGSVETYEMTLEQLASLKAALGKTAGG